MSDFKAPDASPATPASVQTAEIIDVLINRRSGTVLNLGEDVVRQGLESALGNRLGTLRFIEGAEIKDSVRSWTQNNAGGKRGLILGGGDGSVLTAAAEFLGRDDITLGVLPLGTHNLFARQLGFAADFRQAAAQYKDVEATKVDVGNVNGKNFLVGLMIDKNSVDFYAAREELRDGKRFAALSKIFGLAQNVVWGRTAKLTVDGQEQAGKIFIVTNNQLAPRDNGRTLPLPANFKPIVENILNKGSQDDGKLAFYAFQGGPGNLAAILTKIWDGSWTKAKSVTVKTAPELVIQPGKKSTAALPIILDGEVTTTSSPLHVKLLPKGLKVYRPK